MVGRSNTGREREEGAVRQSTLVRRECQELMRRDFTPSPNRKSNFSPLPGVRSVAFLLHAFGAIVEL